MSQNPTDYPLAALPYAQHFTDCAPEGYQVRNDDCGYCAIGVRHATMCMLRKYRGHSPYVHCGSGAFAYYGNGCLEGLGFVNDMSACNTPGVIRVYFGPDTKVPNTGRNFEQNNTNCDNAKGNAGDVCGHIEFLGTDQRWHWSCAPGDTDPRDVTSGGDRILKACYVLSSTGGGS